MVYDVFVFGVSLAAILWGGGFLVRALARTAAFLEVSEFLVSFVLVAVATSLPELFIGIASGVSGDSALSFGNIMGSNAVNLTLMLAIPAFLARGLAVGTAFASRDLVYMVAIVVLPTLFLIDGMLSRVDGVMLVAAFVWYIVILFRQREYFTRPLEEGAREEEETVGRFWRDLGLIALGLAILIGGSIFLVDAASRLAGDIGVPVVLIGVLIVGIGTNLPELAFGMQAVAAAHGGMVLGGILGSVVANAGLILGLSVLLSPLSADTVPMFAVEGAFLLIAALTLGIAMRTGKRLSVFEGIVLTALYGIFVLVEFQFLSHCIQCQI